MTEVAVILSACFGGHTPETLALRDSQGRYPTPPRGRPLDTSSSHLLLGDRDAGGSEAGTKVVEGDGFFGKQDTGA